MDNDRDNQKTPPNTGKPGSEQNLVSSRNALAKPGEVEIVQPKQGIWRTYDGTDGLHPWVSCLLQDRQGYLWLGTKNGLRRYDGEQFITYTVDDGLAGDFVRSICEDSQGRLWIGTDGDGVSCYDGKQFITYTADDGLVDDVVRSICEDSQGRLWFGTDGGISCYNWEDFTNYTTKDGLFSNNIRSIYEDSQGRLWFREWRGDGVSCYDGQRFINYTTEDELAYKTVLETYEDRQQRLWHGTDSGVCCFDGSGFTVYTTADGLLDNRVHDILQDREGSFWFIHYHSGMTRFDPETIRLLTAAAVSETLIQTSEGALWFGDFNKLCCLYKGEQRCYTLDSKVCSVMEDSNKRLWVGTARHGLYCYNSTDAVWEGNARRFTTEDGLNSTGAFFTSSLIPKGTQILSVIEARDGTIWVGTGGSPGCLCRFDGARFETIQTPHPAVQRLLEDNYGRIWMGGWDGGGLSYVGSPTTRKGENLGSPSARKENSEGEGRAASLHNYTTEHGLPSDSVISIMEDDAGRLWIGTADGLCCFHGNQFISYDEEIAYNGIYQFSAMDVNGQLWFGTLGNGVYRYDGRHFQQLSKADGLPSNGITGLIPQEDGSMIIGTYNGIVHYRPTATVPPNIEIREVVADQMYSHPNALELTTTDADLVTISYHGLSLSTHRMRYSYILEGYDKGWRDTWESQVRYEELAPGEYTFRVIAINRDLVCSEAPATLKLTILPDPRDEQITKLEIELDGLRHEVSHKYHFSNFIGESAAVRQVHALMERAIDSGLTVLITGETGVGKELVARAIHHNSPRKNKPLLDRNCGAIPSELLAGELFGHRKGAFTGAKEDKMGLFEAASGGTVQLDEIGEMPQDAQVHLLRFLEEREVQRLGENVSRPVDVRIIATTNRDLAKEVTADRFREDLYYRLSEFPIHIPPLRERPEDIPILAEHFLKDVDKALDGFESGAFEMLQSYPWPGNVRELRNVIRRAAALTEEGKQIQTYHFPPGITQGESLVQEIISEQIGYSESLNQFRRRLVEEALRECNGNRTQAARLLKMNRSNLVNMIKRLGIDL
ncbi:sigma 54-interacting transcriptional regulator [Candidatus Poribacteria bacterium]